MTETIKLSNSQKHQAPHLQYFIFFVTYEGSNQLDCYITLSWKGSPETNTLAYWVFCL